MQTAKMVLSINGLSHPIGSIEEMAPIFDRLQLTSPLEAWLSIADGPSLCMLREANHAFLMYLRAPGDNGFTSRGSDASRSEYSFTLANGQVDHYPASWCVELELCIKALTYFCVNHGARAPWVNWHED